MDSFSFVIRTAIATAVIVVLMQVKWGNATVEEHTMSFLTTSSLTKTVDQTAHGAVVFIRNSWGELLRMFDTNFSNSLKSENLPGQREARFQIKRSQEYLSKQSDSLAERTQGGVDRARNRIRKFIDETYVPGQEQTSQATDSQNQSQQN